MEDFETPKSRVGGGGRPRAGSRGWFLLKKGKKATSWSSFPTSSEIKGVKRAFLSFEPGWLEGAREGGVI